MNKAHQRHLAKRDARALLALCGRAQAPKWKVREVAAAELQLRRTQRSASRV